MPPKPRLSAFSAIEQLACHRQNNRLHCLYYAPRLLSTPSSERTFASTSRINDGSQGQYIDGPKWNETPRRMRAPVSLKRNAPENRFAVNESADVLNEVYQTVLGEDGDKLLTEEVKWLAVTHKSFDQGRRGYNDRLAFLGKRIVDLQTSLALLNRADGTFIDPPDEYEREPFKHPGVDLLPRLSEQTKGEFVSLPRIASIANRLGLAQVVRWRPRKAYDLKDSGSEKILAQALYAIVGAVALQRGGEIAARLVRERILSRMGLDA